MELLKEISKRGRSLFTRGKSTLNIKSEIDCDIFGEDRTVRSEELQSSGEFLVNEYDELSYDVGSKNVRKVVESGVKGEPLPCSLLCEPSSAPFDFDTLDWSTEESNDAVILRDMRVIALSQAVNMVKQQELGEKLGIAMAILAAVFSAMCLFYMWSQYSGGAETVMPGGGV